MWHDCISCLIESCDQTDILTIYMFVEILHDCARLAASKFTDEELELLKKTWQDLADRSTGKGVDKETFLQYLPLSGLLGMYIHI